MITCRRCGSECKDIVDEKNFDLHHIIPRCIQKEDNHKRIYLCKKCHNEIHHILNKVIFNYVDATERCKEGITKFTLNWIKK